MQGELEAGSEVPEKRRWFEEEHGNQREVWEGFDEVVEDGGEQGRNGENEEKQAGAEDDGDFADGGEEGGV